MSDTLSRGAVNVVDVQPVVLHIISEENLLLGIQL